MTNNTIFTRLDGFIIENGVAAGETNDDQRGGGLVAHGATPDNYWLKVSRCRFQSNNAVDGGAVAAYRPVNNATNYMVEMTDCEFTDNHAAVTGGAMYVYGSKVVVNNSLFVGNKAESFGGAIALDESCEGNPTDCGIRNCLANPFSTVLLNSCTLTENVAGDPENMTGGEGGGAFVRLFMNLRIDGSIL